MRRYSKPIGITLAIICSGYLQEACTPPDESALRPAINVVELTVQDIQQAYASKEYTSVELTQAFLDQIDLYEGHYNAFISMNPNAMEIASQLDEERESGQIRGPLHGVPVVIKDNIDYQGLVTTAGFSGFSSKTGGIDMIPDDDAAVVERLRNAGAIILGKTNLPDFAGDGTRTKSSVSGVTLNAYDVTKAPGGSSGGTATAVNASFAVLGLGTETGGSIQNPAGSQALVGIKPTFGLVPLEGVVPINATYIDVVGPLAKTVYDAAITLDIIAGPSLEDLATFASVDHMPIEGYTKGLTRTNLAGKRFGSVGLGWREQWLPLSPETEKLYRESLDILEGRGASIVDDPFENSGFVELYKNRPRVPSVGPHDMMVYMQGLGDSSLFNSVQGWETLTGQTFRGGRMQAPPTRPSATEEGDAFQAWRLQIRDLYRNILQSSDLDGLFFPQAGAPIRNLIEDPQRPDYSPNNHPELASNIINELGVPLVTVPFSYYQDGTPFVVVFIGDLWTEQELLGYAYDFEQTTLGRVPPSLFPEPSDQ
ncbi:MAG TPA: amidase [Gemmatimonadetes bacterium]|jgi:Asp-tRNA(Asn)/Glu-tRNA(Gln) amidotransferase A subunit family amidase|nr:amidase [Gemmatimonadota bacterium]